MSGGGGDLVVRDSRSHEVVVGGHGGAAMLAWAGASSVVEHVSFHDNHLSALHPSRLGGLWGPLRLENSGEARVERVVSRDEPTLSEVYCSVLYQVFLGQVVSEAGASVRNVGVRNRQCLGQHAPCGRAGPSDPRLCR